MEPDFGRNERTTFGKEEVEHARGIQKSIECLSKASSKPVTCLQGCVILEEGVITFRKMLLGAGKRVSDWGECEDSSQNMHTLTKPCWGESMFHMAPERCFASPPGTELGQ